MSADQGGCHAFGGRGCCGRSRSRTHLRTPAARRTSAAPAWCWSVSARTGLPQPGSESTAPEPWAQPRHGHGDPLRKEAGTTPGASSSSSSAPRTAGLPGGCRRRAPLGAKTFANPILNPGLRFFSWTQGFRIKLRLGLFPEEEVGFLKGESVSNCSLQKGRATSSWICLGYARGSDLQLEEFLNRCRRSD